MLPPKRKRIKPISPDELLWRQEEGIPDSETEIDVPSADKIELAIENEFRIMNNNNNRYLIKDGPPTKMLKAFYKYVDEINMAFNKYSPCKRGCSKCCRIPVDVSDLEINIIKHFLDKNKVKYIQRKPQKIYAGDSDKLIGKEYTGIACIFLKDNECSIYPVRPFKCRSLITFEDTNDKCDGEDSIKLIYLSSYVIERTYEAIIKLYLKKKGVETDFLQPYQIFSELRENFKRIG